MPALLHRLLVLAPVLVGMRLCRQQPASGGPAVPAAGAVRLTGWQQPPPEGQGCGGHTAAGACSHTGDVAKRWLVAGLAVITILYTLHRVDALQQ